MGFGDSSYSSASLTGFVWWLSSRRWDSQAEYFLVLISFFYFLREKLALCFCAVTDDSIIVNGKNQNQPTKKKPWRIVVNSFHCYFFTSFYLTHSFWLLIKFDFTFSLTSFWWIYLFFNRLMLMRKKKKVRSLKTAWMFLMTAALVLLVL